MMKPVIFLIAGFISFIASAQVTLQYADNQAAAIKVTAACSSGNLQVRLMESPLAMLGSLNLVDGGYVFTPVIPFSPGNKYEVYCDDQLLASFTPSMVEGTTPRVAAIFPSQDTVPENLLKMHIKFSQPMASGNSYSNIIMTENGLPVKPFLELESELWNEDHTVFTLWLDPGRIKRDLTPNKLYGNPLSAGKEYLLKIDSGWRAKNGTRLENPVTRELYVGGRDESLPDPHQWKVSSDAKEISIEFNEPLDYLLIHHAFTLLKNDTAIPCKTMVISNTQVKLIPEDSLFPGQYSLAIDPKLEDLAGNNLTRAFDRDLQKDFPIRTLTLPITITGKLSDGKSR